MIKVIKDVFVMYVMLLVWSHFIMIYYDILCFLGITELALAGLPE